MIGRALKGTTKGVLGTRTGRQASKLGTKAAVKASKGAGKAALKGGKGQAGQALSSQQSAGPRYLKYGLVALAGFAIGALVARSGSREDALSYTGGVDQAIPNLGDAGGGSTVGTGSDPTAPTSYQRPEDPNRTGTGRDYSDPSAGPLIGRSHQPDRADVPVQHEEIENRIRTRVGEDPRTADVPHLNVEVNDTVVDLRGQVHSEEEKQAIEEIASETAGVTEVRNLLTVNPDAPRRKADGGDGPTNL